VTDAPRQLFPDRPLSGQTGLTISFSLIQIGVGSSDAAERTFNINASQSAFAVIDQRLQRG
jgi:hypothetical protein